MDKRFPLNPHNLTTKFRPHIRMNSTVLHSFSSTRTAATLDREYGRKRANITVTAQLHQLGGNAMPHFSVTAEIYNPGHRDNAFAGGCLHEEVLRFWPALAPVVKMHLSDSAGAPMHAVENGFYWLKDGNLENLASHLRISLEEAGNVKSQCEASNQPKEWFTKYCENLRPMWKMEAEEAIRLIEELNVKQAERATVEA